MKRILKVLVPLLILLFGFAFLFVYDFYLEGRINTVSVVVAEEDIGFKDSFSKRNLTIKRVNRDDLVSGAVKNVTDLKDADLLGKLAAIDIKKGTQIYRELVDANNLIPDESAGEFIAPIPDKWIFAIPGSIRRSYIADFYVIPKRNVQQLKSSLRNENQRKSVSGGEHDASLLADYEKTVGRGPVLEDVRVAYTKDQSNNEVTNANQGEKYSSTGVVSTIEIIATQQMLDKLRKYTQQGDQLYIVYKFER
ncbi:MAG TPA: flagellar biosynthesis protein FlgA [Bacillales bacterium]|nr:flagellar biosynthesis protein FlgA [Bacillales bacterium]